MTKRTAVRTTLRAVATGTSLLALLGLAPAAPVPVPRAPAPAPASVTAAWKVFTLTTGDDGARDTAAGAARAKVGTVFHEPRADAWYVQHGDRIEPLDEDARRAAGAHGITVAAYRERVARAYGDGLPGSAYGRRGAAGAHRPAAAAPDEDREPRAPHPVTAGAFGDDSLPVTAATSVAGAAALLALGLSASAALRRRRSA
ncbi:hypothetical protein RM550_33505 [Streptomyces sp. DSM 41527]|uniref:Gram-positive cocci surface proteins LPxTG domain-containing protein n=1 Tax=Streptomyces mooreae TaxID=3075523 RepID=A0ABU2TI16_9ACTN|nr:hypothetical protein [Streptomyces sp. DSM 41527]MDT0460586.1 hypothetical protein [Streptomyces sp. DSM 41527]